MDLDFTGERYVPNLHGQIRYEHLHRYMLAATIIAGKNVLDVASGEGYGSAILASSASCVTGVDVDASTVEHAKSQYSTIANLQFLVGSCDRLPLPDASVDVVTSFETIEHHDKHEEMMGEVKRVLTKEGVLLLSSPNRRVYSDEPGYVNPFHVKELYYEDLISLLRRHFQYVEIVGQRLATASFMAPVHEPLDTCFRSFAISPFGQSVAEKVLPATRPVYFIALCSDSPLPQMQEMVSVYVDAADDLLQEAGAELAHTVSELKRVVSENQEMATNLHQSRVDLHQSRVDLEQARGQLTSIHASRYWKLWQTARHLLKK